MSTSFVPRQSVPGQPNRREFMRAVGVTAAGLATAEFATAASTVPGLHSPRIKPAKNLIFLHLSGGPSQIDTFDPKPLAGAEYRNLDAACQTSLPGVLISENLPQLATQLHHVSLIRTLHHDGPATHEMGHCQFQSRYLPSPIDIPVASDLRSAIAHQPFAADSVILGQSSLAGPLPRLASSDTYSPGAWDDVLAAQCARLSNLESLTLRSRDKIDAMYGSGELGMNCWRARMLLERGVRQVTIHQFATVYDQTTWDMHANGGRLNSTNDDYRQLLCPQLDMALTALLNDLRVTGLIDETIVVAVGEMGRTPRINAYGGRDHHSGVWTGLIAGGPIRSGQIIGVSDATASEPLERAVSIAEFNATLGYAIGCSTGLLDEGGRALPGGAHPVSELL